MEIGARSRRIIALMTPHPLFAIVAPAALVASCLALTACPGGASESADTGGPSSTGALASSETGSSGATPTTGDTTPTGSSGDASSTGDAPTGEVEGCDGATLLPVPADSSLAGPWPVGVKTVMVGGLTVEVWYPGTPGSEAGIEPRRYDIRGSLPDSEKLKVPDAKTPWQDCDCYADVPLDAAHGPYPAVVFVHGTAGFRAQSLEHVTHWASRGFVVLAADHPGLWLADLLGQLCGQPAVPQHLAADIATLVAAIEAPAGELEFLAGHLDGARIGMAGHSAGGGAIANSGDVAQVLIPMAAGGVTAGAALRSTLVLGAQSDQIVDYGSQQSGYASSPAPKRLVGISNAGHLAFSSLCSLANADGQDFVEIAGEFEICGAQFASALFDCVDTYTPDATSWAITNYATSAVLEEALHCTSNGDAFAGIMAKFPEVGEVLEEK